jgi:hypothetical protein
VSIQPQRSRLLALLLSTLAAALLFVLPAHSQLQPTPLFAQPTVIPTGNWPAAVYSADINRDGFPDLIYIDQGALPNQPSTTHVLLNDGKGNFKQSAVLATVGNSLAIGRIAGDGFNSIAWFEAQSTGFLLHVAYGNGDGTFQPPSPCTAPCSPRPYPVTPAKPPQFAYLISGQLQSAEYSAQVIAEDIANNLVYCIGWNPDGTTNFSVGALPDGAGPASVYSFGSSLSELGFLVVNGLPGGTAQVFRNGLDPVIGPPPSPYPPTERLAGVSGIRSLLLQDVDNDSIPDLIAEGANGRFDIFHGNGDGTFATSSEGGSQTLDGLTGHGGHLIAETTVANGTRRNFYTATPAGISVLTGNGNLTYTLQGIYNAGPGRTSYALADFNGDGYPDLALDSPEGIAILFGNPDGTLQSSQAFVAGQPAMSGTLGAFTASGHLDAVVSIDSRQAQLLRGNGDGTFTLAASPATTQPGTPGLWSIVQALDLNNDGKLDLAVTADGPSPLPGLGVGVTIALGNGDGTFTTPQFIASHDNPGASPYFGVSAAGPTLGLPGLLNLDSGHLWSIANSNAFDPSTPTATSVATLADPHPHNLVVAGNLRKGFPADLFLQDQGSLKLFLSNGNTVAATPLGDLAVDGSLTSPGQLTAPDLSSTFGGQSNALGFPAFPGAAVIADLDGDGNGDLLVAYDNMGADHTAPTSAAPNYLYIWYGSGGGKFLTSAKHPVNPVRLTPSRNFYQLAIADLNGDKIPDLILSDGYVLSVQFGNGDGSFQAEQHFLAGQGLNTISVGDVNGDGKQDLVLANGGTVFSNPVANKEVLTPNPDVNTGGLTVLLNTYVPTDLAINPTLTATPNPTPFEGQPTLPATFPGQPVTVTASFTTPAGVAQPTGTVNFYLNTNTQPTGPPTLVSLGPPVNVDNGSASLSLPASFTPVLLPGPQGLVASYSGDSVYGPEPAFATILNVALGPTSVVLTPTTPLTVSYGGPINGTFVISVLDSKYPYTGSYTLFDNGVAVPECTAISTAAECPYGAPQLLNAGPHVFTITYNGGPANGDPINASSTSAPIAYTVLPDTTTATLTSSLNPAPYSTAVTFTATLAGNLAIPTGTVQFLDNGVVLGTGALTSAGVATYTTSTLAVGTHPITAFYPATTNFNASTSNLVQEQIVTIPTLPISGGFTLTVTPSPVSIGVGRTAVLLVTVQDTGGFSQPVQLSCANLPPESTCTFLQPLISAGGGATTLQVSTMAPHDCGDPNNPYFLGGNAAPGTGKTFAALLLLGLTGLLRKRRTRRSLRMLLGAFLLLVSLGGLTALNGCGHCTDLGTRPATYILHSIGTAQGTPITQTQTQPVPFTVTM